MPCSKEDISVLRHFLPLPSSGGCTRHWLLPPQVHRPLLGPWLGLGLGPWLGPGLGLGLGPWLWLLHLLLVLGVTAHLPLHVTHVHAPLSPPSPTPGMGSDAGGWRWSLYFGGMALGSPSPPCTLHTCCFSLAPAPLLWASFSFTLSLRYRSLRDLHLFIHSGTVNKYMK